MKFRRINLYGGPGVAKSTTAAKIFVKLKESHHDVELISEYVKTMAHEKRVPQNFDQLYIFAKQVKAEDIILRNVKVIVTDSPILMNAAYSTKYGFVCSKELVLMAQEFDKQFPALNFFINRTVDYVEKGRYQNYQQAVEFDSFLLDFLRQNLQSPLQHIQLGDFDQMMQNIQFALQN